MFRFFTKNDSDNEEQINSSEEEQNNSDESYEPQPKTMADYYDDLEAIIAKVRNEVKDADQDQAFSHAATILTEVITLCRNIESSLNPIAVLQTNSQRSKLLKMLGPDGLIEVKGEASKLLAIEYRKLMIAMANKEYWPNPPMLYARLVHSRYESELEKRADETQLRIQKYQDRIDAYEKSKTQAAAGSAERHAKASYSGRYKNK